MNNEPVGVALDPVALQAAQKYLGDRNWRINNLYYIVGQIRRDGRTEQEFIKFKPNRVQRHFDKHKHTKNIIGKSRQHGFTTWETIDCLDQAIFGKNENIMIITKSHDDAAEIFQLKAKRAWEAMNPFVTKMVNIGSSTTSMMEFINGEGTKSRFSVGTTGIGMTLTRAHISELSYLDVHSPKDADNVIRGVMAAAKFGRIDIESTGRSDYGHFYDYFMNAKDETPTNPSEFKRFFYNWQWDDMKLATITEGQIKEITSGQGFEWDKFKEYQKLHDLTDREITAYYFFWIDYNRDWDLLHSEYPTTIEEMFSSGTDRLFSGDALDKQVVINERKEGRWKFFHDYDEDNKYCIGVDVAEGIGKDSSAISVIDVTNNRIVATYVNDRIAPDTLAYEIVKAAKKYGEPLVSVERNNHGHTTLSKLREIYDTKRIYKEIVKDKLRANRTFKFGWHTNSATKPKMFYDLSTVVNSNDISLSDANLVLEARMYTKDKVRIVRPKDGETSHSDLLTATTIAWQTRVDAMAVQGRTIYEDNGELTAKLKELQAKQFMP